MAESFDWAINKHGSLTNNNEICEINVSRISTQINDKIDVNDVENICNNLLKAETKILKLDKETQMVNSQSSNQTVSLKILNCKLCTCKNSFNELQQEEEVITEHSLCRIHSNAEKIKRYDIENILNNNLCTSTNCSVSIGNSINDFECLNNETEQTLNFILKKRKLMEDDKIEVNESSTNNIPTASLKDNDSEVLNYSRNKKRINKETGKESEVKEQLHCSKAQINADFTSGIGNPDLLENITEDKIEELHSVVCECKTLTKLKIKENIKEGQEKDIVDKNGNSNETKSLKENEVTLNCRMCKCNTSIKIKLSQTDNIHCKKLSVCNCKSIDENNKFIKFQDYERITKEKENAEQDKTVQDHGEICMNNNNLEESENSVCHCSNSEKVLLKQKEKDLTSLVPSSVNNYNKSENVKKIKELKCLVCSYKTENKRNFKKHEKTHENEKAFDNISNDNESGSSRETEEILKCSLCKYKTTKKQNLKQHEKKHNNEKSVNNNQTNTKIDKLTEEEEIFHCALCSYKTTNKKYIKRHEKHHRDKQLEEERMELFNCSLCKYKTYRKRNLKRHAVTHTERKIFSCTLCGFKTYYKVNLQLHERNHSGENLLRCKFCDYQTPSKGNLKRHEQTHTGEKPFLCTLCGYKTLHVSNLKLHEKTHTSEKPLQCSFCQYRTANQSNLKRHEKSHLGEKPFGCTFCNYKTIHMANLKLHEASHTNEKPFECSLCHYKTASRSNLKRHEKRHTGEKPFVCSSCDYKTIHMANLRLHEATHLAEKLYQCSLCSYKTSSKNNLKRHEKTHSGEKILNCSICDYKTCKTSDLKTHEETHSGEVILQCIFLQLQESAE